MLDARVVARRETRGTEPLRVLETDSELDLPIACDVGIGGATRGQFVEKMPEHALAVLGGEVHVFDLDTDDVGHRGRVDKIDVAGAVFVVVVTFPVLHEDADDIEALLLEQPRAHRGIDPAAQAHDHALHA